LVDKGAKKNLLLYAHRGASARVPENTMEAFFEGLSSGANALELDVRRTKDGVLVVFHDHDGGRLAHEERTVKDVSLEEIKTWDVSKAFKANPVTRHFVDKEFRVPTFEEVLSTFPQVRLNVDIKPADMGVVQMVVDTIRRVGAADRVLLSSFRHQNMDRVHELGYEGPTGFSKRDVLKLLLTPLSFLRRLKGSNVQVPPSALFYRFGKESFIEKCHRLGLKVEFWTVNTQKEASELLEMGADGIMSDDPALIRPTFVKFDANWTASK